MAINLIVNILTAIAFGAIIVGYIYCFENGKIEEPTAVKRIFNTQKSFTVITAAVYLAMTVLFTIFANKHGYTEYALLRNLVFLFMLYLLAVTDIKKKRIPNKIILAMLVIRLPFLAVEIIQNVESWKTVLRLSLGGFVLSMAVAFAMMLISRNQMGGGDVKLLSVIGLYVGLSNAMTVIFFSFIFCGLGGLVLIITKKCSWKDSVPFAPFIFMGTLVYYLLMYILGSN